MDGQVVVDVDVGNRMVERFGNGGDGAGSLRSVDLSAIGSATIAPPEYAIEPIVPCGFTTLLGAHGGMGKSILALTLAAHCACGRNFGPFRVHRNKVKFVEFEDHGDLMRYRLRNICEEYTLPIKEVRENLEIIDGTEAEAMAVETNLNGTRSLMFTATANAIREKAQGAGLVFIDNASDAFDANENERRMVRAFVRYLTGMVKSHGGAVVLLAHIDKSAARYGASGNTYSGSTAWHNSTRSRIALIDGDLIHEKLNVGKKHEQPIPLVWTEHGVLVPDFDGTGKAAAAALLNGTDDMAVMSCLSAAEEAGETVSAASRGPVTAWHTLRQFPECPEPLKTSKLRLQESILRLARDGMIRRVEYTNQYRNKRERWEIVRNV